MGRFKHCRYRIDQDVLVARMSLNPFNEEDTERSDDDEF
jgi:hypothetical protein